MENFKRHIFRIVPSITINDRTYYQDGFYSYSTQDTINELRKQFTTQIDDFDELYKNVSNNNYYALRNYKSLFGRVPKIEDWVNYINYTERNFRSATLSVDARLSDVPITELAKSLPASTFLDFCKDNNVSVSLGGNYE